jgi:RNA polymerase sigma-70 factor (ECF subfamily)
MVAAPEGEAELLDLARDRDPQAFVDLVTRYRGPAWAVCLRITGNPHDAEDALQEALTAAWRNLDRFRGDARFGTWLHRIAANAALAVVRRRRDLPTDDDAFERAAPGDAFAARDESDRIQTALRRIPEDFRVALVLREYGDLTYEEIAAHQGIPVQTVKSRLNRARRAMAELLADQPGHDAAASARRAMS